MTDILASIAIILYVSVACVLDIRMFNKVPYWFRSRYWFRYLPLGGIIVAYLYMEEYDI